MDHDEGPLRSVDTYLWALDLAPLALPPDLPPVILTAWGDWVGLGGVVELVVNVRVADGWSLMECR